MKSTIPHSETFRASFVLANETDARHASDLLTETVDGSDTAIAAFERPDGRWDVAVHFANAPNVPALQALVAEIAGRDIAAAMVLDTVAAQDWVKTSLEGLAPVRAGCFIVHGAHDRSRIPPNAIGVEIEAALAFGTGHHGTTQGCLTLLDRVLRRYRPRRVLDLGTGTGVLAIAAAKALRHPVLASDIDERSALVARENAALNKVAPLVKVIHATGFNAPQFAARAPFDLVLANILASPLRRLAPQMTRHLAPSAHVILSGLLQPHVRGVVAAYRASGLVLLREIRIDGWSSLLMRHNGPA